MEYVGELIRASLADGREQKYQSEGIVATYFFRINRDWVVDATKKGCVARFFNHSCAPNAMAKVISVDGKETVAIYALQDIERGEEITFDYKFAPVEDEDAKIVCGCGAPNCRGLL